MIVIVIVFLNVIQALLIDDLYINSTICMWSYLLLLFIELNSHKKISLISVFIFAFIFMIPPEGILHARQLYSEWGSHNVDRAIEFLIISSSILILCHKLSYVFFRNKYKLMRTRYI